MAKQRPLLLRGGMGWDAAAVAVICLLRKAAGGIGLPPKIYNWRVKLAQINRVGKSPKLLERGAESIPGIRESERERPA